MNMHLMVARESVTRDPLAGMEEADRLALDLLESAAGLCAKRGILTAGQMLRISMVIRESKPHVQARGGR